MRPTENAALLLDSFSKQESLYKNLEDANRAFFRAQENADALTFIREKHKIMLAIGAEDKKTQDAKTEWLEGKEQWEDVGLKEKVEDALARLTDQISRTIESEKEVEVVLRKVPKPAFVPTAIDKYRSQSR